MKKIAILLLVMFVAVGAAVAQPAGLYIGGELGVGSFSNAGDTISIKPYVGFETEIIQNLEVYAELGLPIGPFNPFTVGLDLDLGVQYNLPLNFGRLHFGLGLPMGILNFSGSSANFFQDFGLKFTIGADTNAGFGGHIQWGSAFISGGTGGFSVGTMELLGYYRWNAFRFSLALGSSLEAFDTGLYFTPGVDFSLNSNLLIYARLPLGGFSGSFRFGLTAGVKYSF